MKYTTLGANGIKVSKICLGTMTFGEQNSPEEAFEQLNYALDQGVNFIDTAEMYSVPAKAETYGRTEEIIGDWLAATGRRNEIVLATKAAGPSPRFTYIRNNPNFSRKQLTEALENSLRRLKTDHVDLYQLHWPERSTNFFGQLGYQHQSDDTGTPFEDILRTMESFISSGKVRAIGISNETPWGMSEFYRVSQNLGLPHMVTVQNPYSLLNRVFEVGMAEMAIRNQTGLLAYSPLGFGVLSGKYLNGQPKNARVTLYPNFNRYSNPAAVAATRSYAALAKEHGLQPAQMALAYVNTRPFLTSNIIGATTMAQLKENIASIDVQLSKEVLEGIEQIHLNHPNPSP